MTRNCRFEMRFSKEELSNLTKKARKAKLSNAAFIRRAICGTEVKQPPNVDVPMYLNETRRLGYSLNQILKVANGQGFLDVPRLRKVLDDLQSLLKRANDAFALCGD